MQPGFEIDGYPDVLYGPGIQHGGDVSSIVDGDEESSLKTQISKQNRKTIIGSLKEVSRSYAYFFVQQSNFHL